MSENTQNSAEMQGKVDSKKHRFYGETDLSNLDYLEHRDVSRIAKDLSTYPQKVSSVRHFKVKDTQVMAALLKKGGERKKTLTEATA